MSPSFWKRLSVIQAICILALIVGAIGWNHRTRRCTRTETLRAFYDSLALPSERNGIYTPVVVDVNFEQQRARYFVNGEAMDSEALTRFVKSVLQSDDPRAPFVVRTARETPFPKIAAAMQVLIGDGVKVLGLPMEEGLLVLTDRGFAPRADVLMPESVPGLE